ncbi:hypothetical protein DITRI_Ditri19aG0119600 [Diplodiscus trichospermus]
MHEYPLQIVEHSGFVDFVKTLQPQFNMVSFNTIQRDCVTMYLKEKRVSLALDLWVSNQTVGYVLLIVQFIDAEWNLHHRLLNEIMVSSIDSSNALQQAILLVGNCFARVTSLLSQEALWAVGETAKKIWESA